MRVLYLMDDIGGGTGTHVLSFIPHLRSVDPVFATTARAVRSRLADADFDVYHIPAKRWYDLPVVHQARMLLDLYRFARGREVEVIHTYFFWSIIFGRILKRLIGARLLVENREDMGFQWGWFEYVLLRLGSHVPDRVICVAGAVRDQALARESLPSEKTLVVRNGLDPSGFGAPGEKSLRGELGIPVGAPVIGVVANMRKVKRLDRLVRAGLAIRERLPGARIVIAGRGVETESLKKLTAELGLEGTVLFTGFRTEMAPVYDSFDLTVLTSESEGCSITILESFCAGLPVVVTDVGGNGELVDDGVNGFVVPEWDEERFVERVVLLLTDEERRRSMGAAGREKVISEHAISAVAERYETVYRGGTEGSAGWD